MKYEERITIIKKWFKESITTRFSLPTGVDPSVVVNDTVEAINSYIPSSANKEQIGNILSSITKDVSRSARSRTLPIVKEFLDATKSASNKLSVGPHSPASSDWDNDTYKITEARIRRGEAISEIFLRGTMRDRLLETTSIRDKDLEPYEKYLANAAHKQ